MVRSGQVRSGQVRSGQVRSGQVRSGQVRSGQVRSGQVICYSLHKVVSSFSFSAVLMLTLDRDLSSDQYRPLVLNV
jgi:hypothetical protein